MFIVLTLLLITVSEGSDRLLCVSEAWDSTRSKLWFS